MLVRPDHKNINDAMDGTNMLKKDVILVTAVGNLGPGSQIVECLYKDNNGNLSLIGTDINPEGVHCVDLLDKFYEVPRANDPEYGKVIENIILENSVDLVFVGSMYEAIWTYRNASFFKMHNVRIVLGNEELFQLCMDKNKLFKKLENNGIDVPKYKLITCVEDCFDIDYFPCVLKPNKFAIASNHIYLAYDMKDLLLLSQYTINKEEMIAQEWKGNSTHEYSVSIIYFSKDNPCKSIAIKRDFSSSISKKATYKKNNTEYIVSSGITQGIVDNDMELLSATETIARSLHSVGSPLNIQGIWDDGKFWLIDAHPAITGGAYIRALAGFNEPAFWVDYLLHNKIREMHSDNVRIRRYMNTVVEDI